MGKVSYSKKLEKAFRKKRLLEIKIIKGNSFHQVIKGTLKYTDENGKSEIIY